MNPQLITIDPEVHSGTPVFRGTRVPVKTLFDHIEAGDSLEVFLDDFPSVSRNLAMRVLEQARAALMADAHPLRDDGDPSPSGVTSDEADQLDAAARCAEADLKEIARVLDADAKEHAAFRAAMKMINVARAA